MDFLQTLNGLIQRDFARNKGAGHIIDLADLFKIDGTGADTAHHGKGALFLAREGDDEGGGDGGCFDFFSACGGENPFHGILHTEGFCAVFQHDFACIQSEIDKLRIIIHKAFLLSFDKIRLSCFFSLIWGRKRTMPAAEPE